MMISKELFCSVMGIGIERLSEFDYKENMASGTGIFYFVDDEHMDDQYQFINIYELAHKCKEWVYKYGYEMVSYHIQDSVEYRCIFAHTSIDLNKGVGFYADTEPEAIFKACQYILDNKEIK